VIFFTLIQSTKTIFRQLLLSKKLLHIATTQEFWRVDLAIS
jgi:hypothetical protein